MCVCVKAHYIFIDPFHFVCVFYQIDIFIGNWIPKDDDDDKFKEDNKEKVFFCWKKIESKKKHRMT